MERSRKWIVIILVIGAFVFLLTSLFKKYRISQSISTVIEDSGMYNLKKIYADSLTRTEGYLYLLQSSNAFLEKGENDSAIQFLNRAKGIQPNAAFIYCQLGKIYLNKQQYDSALTNLNHALYIKPNYRIAKHYKNIVEHRLKGDVDFDG